MLDNITNYSDGIYTASMYSTKVANTSTYSCIKFHAFQETIGLALSKITEYNVDVIMSFALKT